MIKKTYSKNNDTCRATFKLPADVKADQAYLVGEFNGWSESAQPMKKLKDGSFSITIKLDSDSSYSFRYLLDSERWENDWEADAYEPNGLGCENSVVQI